MTWYRAGMAVLFLAWIGGVVVIALCRAATREDVLQAIAIAAHDPQEPTP